MQLLPEDDFHYLLHQFHIIVMYVVMLLCNTGDYFVRLIRISAVWILKSQIYDHDLQLYPLIFSFLDSGHRAMPLLQHHCLLHLSCSFVYILRVFMVSSWHPSFLANHWVLTTGTNTVCLFLLFFSCPGNNFGLSC